MDLETVILSEIRFSHQRLMILGLLIGEIQNIDDFKGDVKEACQNLERAEGQRRGGITRSKNDQDVIGICINSPNGMQSHCITNAC